MEFSNPHFRDEETKAWQDFFLQGFECPWKRGPGAGSETWGCNQAQSLCELGCSSIFDH